MPSSFEFDRYFLDHGVKAAKKKERQLRPFRGRHRPDHKLADGIRQHGCLYAATVFDNQVVYIEGDIGRATADDPNWRAIISAEEKKLIRKIDMKILPLLCTVGFFQFMDKTSISYASVLGIIQDTHLAGAQFGALGSLFYVGYLAMQVTLFADQ